MRRSRKRINMTSPQSIVPPPTEAPIIAPRFKCDEDVLVDDGNKMPTDVCGEEELLINVVCVEEELPMDFSREEEVPVDVCEVEEVPIDDDKVEEAPLVTNGEEGGAPADVGGEDAGPVSTV
jgi:hypothetical protein